MLLNKNHRFFLIFFAPKKEGPAFAPPRPPLDPPRFWLVGLLLNCLQQKPTLGPPWLAPQQRFQHRPLHTLKSGIATEYGQLNLNVIFVYEICSTVCPRYSYLVLSQFTVASLNKSARSLTHRSDFVPSKWKPPSEPQGPTTGSMSGDVRCHWELNRQKMG